MQVDWAPEARRDLQSIHEFLRRDNPDAAESLVTVIDEAARGLAAFPLKGHKGLDGTREWVIPRFRHYLLIYDVETRAGIVTILRVWHQSRHR
ncbi:plasmid stabilization system [Paramagnetospirillum caucaseum]|uniref:Plasmid stabilization system n=1 Tax=Paramagnetospirillum caucaseum TaxID=1244869 RepID=M3A7B3_9PROT|nr:type II toxin-antitoxin system mRNA interferase toxin, RelE/StbE family [Paramagnetospirillum caucaseum]EME68384.1 plasmid stabilization system [Paramagnetospirillum caucaseum]